MNDMTSLKNEALAIAMKEFATEKQLAEDIFDMLKLKGGNTS